MIDKGNQDLYYFIFKIDFDVLFIYFGDGVKKQAELKGWRTGQGEEWWWRQLNTIKRCFSERRGHAWWRRKRRRRRTWDEMKKENQKEVDVTEVGGVFEWQETDQGRHKMSIPYTQNYPSSP